MKIFCMSFSFVEHKSFFNCIHRRNSTIIIIIMWIMYSIEIQNKYIKFYLGICSILSYFFFSFPFYARHFYLFDFIVCCYVCECICNGFSCRSSDNFNFLNLCNRIMVFASLFYSFIFRRVTIECLISKIPWLTDMSIMYILIEMRSQFILQLKMSRWSKKKNE